MLRYLVETTAVGCVLIWLQSYLVRRSRNKLGLPFPPGPKPMPIIGNVMDMPPLYVWQAARVWGQTYGESDEMF